VPAETAAAALRRYAREAGAGILPWLAALAQQENRPQAQAAALEALGEIHTQEAADLAARWAAGEAPREVRRAARRALHRLGERGVHPSTQAAPPALAAAVRPAERIRRAVMGPVDAEGSRLLLLLVDLPLGGAHAALAVASQTHGLVRFQAIESTSRQFERLLEEERGRHGVPLVEIPPRYARWLLSEAVAASRAAHKGLPQEYYPFSQILTPPGAEGEGPGEPLVYAELDPSTVRYRPDLVEQSIELLERPEFAGWFPDPEQVLPLTREWRAAEQGPLVLPPSVVAQRQEQVMRRLVELVLGPGGAAGFRRRLEDNALVLLRAGAEREARLALAAALALEPPDLATARAHPLVRHMAQQALEQALERLGTGAAPAAGEGGAPARGTVTRSGLIIPR
jgi:hypothetical protein